RQVTLQALQLLADIAAVGRERRLLLQASRIERRLGQKRLDALAQSREKSARDLVAPAGKMHRPSPQPFDAAEDFGRESRTLALSHRDEVRGRTVGQRLDRGDLLGGELRGRALDGEELRDQEEIASLEPRRHRKTGGERREARQDRFEKGLVD